MQDSKISLSKNRLAKQIIMFVVMFSTLITFITTAFQLYNNFAHDVQDIERRLSEIENAHLGSITNRVWISDLQELRSHLAGLLNIPDIVYLSVIENGKKIAEAGQQTTHDVINRELNLIYIHNGSLNNIGKLKVVASLESAYQHMYDQILTILLSNAVKTFLVAGFILWLFNQLVTRHLHKIARFTNDLGVDNLTQQLELERESKDDSRVDELDVLASGISTMQKNLIASLSDLHESQNRIHLLLNSTAEAIFGIDQQGNCTFANKACATILGYERDEILGSNMHQLMHYARADGSSIGEKNCLFLSVLRDHQPVHVDDEIFWRKNGEYFYAEYWAYPIINREVLTGVVVTFMDISKRKSTEKELELHRLHLQQMVDARTKELESFCYSVSHDLRAPLRSIEGFSCALQEDYESQLDSTAKDYISRIRASVGRFGDLIDGLLQLSRLSRQELHCEMVNLSEIAEQILNEQRKLDPERNMEFKIEADIKAFGDRQLLYVMMSNLIDNAWKYTAKNEVGQIEFGILKDTGVNTYYLKDNGAGFDMRYEYKLFQEFQRLHTEREFKGTGIGLASVRKIVTRHGGKIWCESAIDKGSVFYFNLRMSDSASINTDSPPKNASIA